jgi:pyruvate dehydrogenase E1 component
VTVNDQDPYSQGPQDSDPEETSEWAESLEQLVEAKGAGRGREIMLSLLNKSHELQLNVPQVPVTDYINTIAPENEPEFPGDEELERRYRRWIRWNAAITVHRAQRPGIGVGGHISTPRRRRSTRSASTTSSGASTTRPAATRSSSRATPPRHLRALLPRGAAVRGSARRLPPGEVQGAPRHPSYPHPRLMPDYWQFPTVSMGLGPINAIYQAMTNKYLTNRGIKDLSDSHVWAFLGDGEMDEVESRGQLQVAANEGLDNLTFVVNCNLQRLDGPVRGNGKIIQELEAFFRGAGWNVIKVVWGRGWDELLQVDTDGALVRLMNTTPDGDFQTYRAEDGKFIRDHFFGRDERTAAMVKDWSDEDIWGKLRRGGLDYQKLYAAYKAATEHKGQPTVILAKTIKGYGLGTTSRAATRPTR